MRYQPLAQYTARKDDLFIRNKMRMSSEEVCHINLRNKQIFRTEVEEAKINLPRTVAILSTVFQTSIPLLNYGGWKCILLNDRYI